MNPERPFLDAIRERPDDDAPRLVYSDWLDEHGDPNHAQFIRLTVGRYDHRWPTKAKALFNKLLPRWLGVFGVPVLTGPVVPQTSGLYYTRRARRANCVLWQWDERASAINFSISFGRGFAEHLVAGLFDSVRIAPALLRSHPAVVITDDLPEHVTDLRSRTPLRIDVGEAWVGAATFDELDGHDKLIPVDPPYHYANTPRKRFHIRTGEDVTLFRVRVARAIDDAVTAAALRAGSSTDL